MCFQFQACVVSREKCGLYVKVVFTFAATSCSTCIEVGRERSG